MPSNIIRSTIFNLLFYIITAISCILLLPTLVLPRKIYLAVVYGFVHTTACLEKHVLGLSYEIRGLENLPETGSYIIAAKHQSTYETFKLHILFKDPAIVLKKELFKIPLWGQYLKKSDVIAIDRSSPKKAIKSIQDGAKRVMAQGRTIVIFPQGTRTSIRTTAKEKPYKIGVVRIQEATNLPIIPLALNTGYFQPKHKWCKKPGRVIFEFLAPIPPGNNPSDILKTIEMRTEEASSRLIEHSKNQKKNKKPFKTLLTFIILVCIAWATNWFVASRITKNAVHDFFEELKANKIILNHNLSEPKVSGFPTHIKLLFPKQELYTAHEELQIEYINAQSLPFISMPIAIETGQIKVKVKHWKNALLFESLHANIIYKNNTLTITESILTAQKSKAQLSGQTEFDKESYPKIDFNLTAVNFAPFLNTLVNNGIVKEKPALFAGAVLTSLEKDGEIQTTITSQDNKIYLGPIKIIDLPKIKPEYETIR